MSEVILFSHHEDDWDCADERIEKAATMAFEDIPIEESKNLTELTLYKGKLIKQEFESFLSTSSIIEQLQDSAYEDCGECAETWLNKVSEEQENELADVICKWAEKNGLAPDFFLVEDIKEVKFKIPQEWHETE